MPDPKETGCGQPLSRLLKNRVSGKENADVEPPPLPCSWAVVAHDWSIHKLLQSPNELGIVKRCLVKNKYRVTRKIADVESLALFWEVVSHDWSRLHQDHSSGSLGLFSRVMNWSKGGSYKLPQKLIA